MVLFGSFVRGDAYPESDLDILAVGKGSSHLKRHDRFLASISWKTADQLRKDFRTPEGVGWAMGGWRHAEILDDPEGVASSLRREALDLDWDAVADQCDAWVAEEVTGLAEEVHRLVGNRQRGRTTVAAVQRSVLAFSLARILAVHRRIIYDSENQIWDLVSEAMGTTWARVQSKALGLGGESYAETCDASLELYALAAVTVQRLLNERQYGVVAHACELAGWPLAEGQNPQIPHSSRTK